MQQSKKKSSEKKWWLYLLACRGGRTYVGIALDVDARFLLHRSGKGAKFTRAYPPHGVLGAKAFPSRSEALKAEFALKRLKPLAKRAWASEWQRSESSSPRPASSARQSSSPRSSSPRSSSPRKRGSIRISDGSPLPRG